MKLLYTTITVSFVLNLVFGYALIVSENKSFSHQQAYIASMEYIESSLRTRGKINNAYTCKVKK